MSSSEDHNPPDRPHRKPFQKYESLAAQYFESLGFTVLERNWRTGHKEVDLVVRRENLLVFVEVKSARNVAFGHPVDTGDSRKISHLSHAARQYLIDYDIHDCDLRFDVVTFINGEMEHFPGAFEAID